MSREVEDGMGFAGLAPTASERTEERYRETRDRIAAAREQKLAEASAELERLRAFIWSLDRKYICTRADENTFIDEGFIRADDVLGSR